MATVVPMVGVVEGGRRLGRGVGAARLLPREGVGLIRELAALRRHLDPPIGGILKYQLMRDRSRCHFHMERQRQGGAGILSGCFSSGCSCDAATNTWLPSRSGATAQPPHRAPTARCCP